MSNQVEEQEIWLAPFPYEEDPNDYKKRPVAIIDTTSIEGHVLCIKITKAKPRDQYDTRLLEWEEAKLDYESTARSSQYMFFEKGKLLKKIGIMSDKDYEKVTQKFMKHVKDQQAKQP